MPGLRRLVGLEAYGCQPHGGTGPQCLRGLDLQRRHVVGSVTYIWGAILAEVKLEDDVGPSPSPD
jgi:hypothetical protein